MTSDFFEVIPFVIIEIHVCFWAGKTTELHIFCWTVLETSMWWMERVFAFSFLFPFSDIRYPLFQCLIFLDKFSLWTWNLFLRLHLFPFVSFYPTFLTLIKRKETQFLSLSKPLSPLSALWVGNKVIVLRAKEIERIKEKPIKGGRENWE